MPSPALTLPPRSRVDEPNHDWDETGRQRVLEHFD